MAKTLSISKQALIVNYKSALTNSSGIEACHVITPLTDGTAGLLILAGQSVGVNRVNLFPRTALTTRGIFETAAQAKYMADLAALKAFFGLTNVGDTASAIGMPYVKLDEGGVFWDTTVASFPTPIFTSNAPEDKITADGNHKLLNYFNNSTGVFDSAPVVPIVTADTTTTKNFLGLTTKQTWIGVGIASVVGLALWNPFKWGKKSKKK